jgi:hypothetical protein
LIFLILDFQVVGATIISCSPLPDVPMGFALRHEEMVAVHFLCGVGGGPAARLSH